jgi:hypothetical protein
MADIGTLNPEQMLQQQQILRQQKMAEMLLQQGQQQPQGQMISGRYVAPSIFQNLAGLANQYVGQRGIEKAQQAQLDLARQLRADETSAMADFMQQRQGRPAEMFAAQAGPTMEGGNIPLQESRAAIPANPQGAYASLMANPKASPRLQNMAFNKLIAEPESYTLSEGAVRFERQPDGTVKQVAAGAQKPRAPLQIDTGTAIELRDPANPTVVLQSIPKSQMPTAGQVVERDDGTFLVNTRTGQATPVIGQGGQPLMGGGKPLTETQGNAVSFGARAVEANRIATDLEKQGVTNTGVIRTVTGGVLGGAPIIGDKLEQNVRSTFNVLPTYLGGPNPQQQQNDQARRDFVSAVLRKESGAAISASEYANEEKKYFPQLGDSEAVIKQKQNSRIKAIEGLKSQAGPSGTRQINRIAGAEQGSSGNVVDFNQLPTGRR